jgi:general secretion pathway protein A
LTISDSGEVKVLKPFDSLLDLWEIPSFELYTLDEFSAFVMGSGLRVERINSATLDDLIMIDRPGLALVKEVSGVSRSRLLNRIEDGIVSLIIDGQVQTFDFETFNKLWSGSFIYLWRPPSSFDILQVDDVNQEAISWLQDTLSLISANKSRLITGGRYTEEVKKQVIKFQNEQGILSDGIVGRQTIMRLNQITDQNIPTLSNVGS